MDNDIYGGRNLSEYHTSISANDDAEYDVSHIFCLYLFFTNYFLKDEETENSNGNAASQDSYSVYKNSINAFSAPKNYLNDVVDDVSSMLY